MDIPRLMREGSDSAKITNLIEPFVAFDVFPNFFHRSERQIIRVLYWCSIRIYIGWEWWVIRWLLRSRL